MLDGWRWLPAARWSFMGGVLPGRARAVVSVISYANSVSGDGVSVVGPAHRRLPQKQAEDIPVRRSGGNQGDILEQLDTGIRLRLAL